MASPAPDLAISARGLRKTYGDVVALDGLDLDVPDGTVLGLLGPNGAGKTTAVSILTTLTLPDAGSATIAGADLNTQPALVRERIGLSGQYAAVDEVLTARENLVMIGRLYRMSKANAKRRAAELLERFSLTDAADRPVKGYSGGMRRRLDLAGALVAEPPVLFLDEPTTGLDPRSRLELWDVIRELVADGATLLLTTQYLEEADQLADDIIVIDKGQAIAQGSSDDLKSQLGDAKAEVVVQDETRLEDARHILTRHTSGEGEAKSNPSTKTAWAPLGGGAEALGAVINDLQAGGIAVSEIGLRRPTLDDVFLRLTGSPTSDDSDQPSDPSASDPNASAAATTQGASA